MLWVGPRIRKLEEADENGLTYRIPLLGSYWLQKEPVKMDFKFVSWKYRIDEFCGGGEDRNVRHPQGGILWTTTAVRVPNFKKQKPTWNNWGRQEIY